MIVINKNTTLESIIIDTIDELGWKNDNVNLLSDISKEFRKQLNIVINPEFFYNGGINKRYKQKQIDEIKTEWLKSGNVHKYDIYLLERLQPNIAKYLEIHNKKWVRISLTDSMTIVPKFCDIYRVSKKKITLINDSQ